MGKAIADSITYLVYIGMAGLLMICLTMLGMMRDETKRQKKKRSKPDDQ